jgi:hypothetical protein
MKSMKVFTGRFAVHSTLVWKQVTSVEFFGTICKVLGQTHWKNCQFALTIMLPTLREY